ncbi:ArsR/SmtB family transcription factor [Zymobacter sp. IVIA_5232.4 C2]|uniref:ArsR/SmtB family transcription factor n=1 Tax=Zymobacter sp. IVIA_5232.4 C2 TaxID=3394855 RepID=UPI0039C1018E
MNRSMQIKAMASELRMTILQLLKAPKTHFSHQWSADPETFGVCMTLIAEALGIAQPTVSRHLDILKQAGFITVQKHQKWSYCIRDEQAIQDYLDWLKHEIALD